MTDLLVGSPIVTLRPLREFAGESFADYIVC